MFSLPLFPLPNVVLFPNVFLPLHIFEPRYRQMVAESLSGDRIIGMVMLVILIAVRVTEVYSRSGDCAKAGGLYLSRDEVCIRKDALIRSY